MAFIDLDDAVESLHVAERGHRRRCREIFSRYGRECFIGYERAALEDLEGSAGQVIALGGGTPVDPESRRLIGALGRVVYLKADPKAVLDRMRHKGFPQYLGENPGLTVLEAFWRERHVIYREVADVTIDNTALSPDETAQVIIDRLGVRDMVASRGVQTSR